MANRDALRQPGQRGGQLVPYAAPAELPQLPLLPYEQDLIAILGITEAEYREHTERVRWKGLTRPAEYAHIPDIRCDPVSIIVSLVIGIALTAVGQLLAPKPTAPADNRVKQRQLRNVQGSDRFGTTSGFDTLNTLADYATPIAIVFARREEGVGGVLVTPQMVWSRAFSYGTEQGVKMMFVVGEGGKESGIARPDEGGIFIGTMALDAVSYTQYAFYWNRNTRINGRILAKNFAYGSRGAAWTGDLQGNDDIFLCPTRHTQLDTAFSGAFSPTNNLQFGCYAPMANGTGYRVNFTLVSIPELDSQPDDEDNILRTERKKVSGDWGTSSLSKLRALGQKGVGREYSRFMGITHLNGESFPGGPNDHKRRVVVKVEDTCQFTIEGGVLEEDHYWTNDGKTQGVHVDDINNATIQFREEADDALQIGTQVMIGRTLWVVESRALPIWGAKKVGPFKERDTQKIRMRCIEVFARGGVGQQIGLISKSCLDRRIRTDDQGAGEYKYSSDNLPGMTVGPGYYPLMKVQFGLVRNTRPCDTTEIGLKSQVWNRANGLCNFASLLTPAELVKADKRKENVRSGTMNRYFPRTSVFTVFLRPAGATPSGEEYPWAPLGEQFAIRGKAPVDQYNFLRFTHPEVRQYEFRFVPKNGGDLTQHSPDEEQFWLLDARINSVSMADARLSGSYNTDYGTFIVHAVGRTVTKGEIEFAPELSTGTKTNDYREVVSVPDRVEDYQRFPDIEESTAKATAVVFAGMLPDGYSKGREAACWYEFWGQASYSGKTSTETRRFDFGGGRFIKLELKGVVDNYFPDNHPYYPGYRAWSLRSVKVVDSSGEMNNNDRLDCRVNISGSNPRNRDGLPYTGIKVVVTDTTALSAPGGRESAWEYEVLGDPETRNIGDTRTKTITLKDGGRSVDVEVKGTIVRGPDAWQSYWGRKKAWEAETYTAISGSASGNWKVGATALHTVTVSAGNPFFKAGEQVGVYFRVTSHREEIEAVGMRSDRVFEENGQITDLSNYSERTTSCESGPEHSITYVNETIANDAGAPQYGQLTTCGLSLRASRNFQSLDQVRVWLATGLEVERFHPAERGTIGPSNLFPDLVHYLLTDATAGLGKVFRAELLDLDSFSGACQFLRTNKLFFNGAIAEPQNLRSYISEQAPYFMLNFVIANGRFALQPAFPVDASGNISTGPVPISALFTAGNIVEDTFKVEYLEADQRRNFIAAMRWRDERTNQLPEERTVTVRWAEAESETYPMESFDMTGFCCSEEHAVKVAKFFLSLRRRVTHTVSFKTSPHGLSLAPGDYIKVLTQASPYQAANNGVIEADGSVIAAQPLADGAYPIYWYDRSTDSTPEGLMTVADGKVAEAHLLDTLFTLKYAGESATVYQVEQLSIEEDGLVEVVAAEFPVTSDLVSQVALDVQSDAFIKDY